MRRRTRPCRWPRRRRRRLGRDGAARRQAGHARRVGGEPGPLLSAACGTLPRAPHDEHSLGVGRGDQLLDEPAVLEKVDPERPAVERDYLVPNLEQRERGRVCCDGLHAHRAARAAPAPAAGDCLESDAQLATRKRDLDSVRGVFDRVWAEHREEAGDLYLGLPVAAVVLLLLLRLLVLVVRLAPRAVLLLAERNQVERACA
mmetsp:Transcript_39096/g.123201  ORF Transcript_39096/g.123201 Transcript_39096/m.123201 type:complete len:202 (+) Transcript_39096:1059-1664(+)